MDKATSGAPGTTARGTALAEPTCSALGLGSSQPIPRSAIAAGALKLLDPPKVCELTEGLTASLDELIVGVVEAVEECMLAPPPHCLNLAVRAEVEAASWVDDFIADDAADDEALLSQHAMFQLACLVADAVAEALSVRTRERERASNPRGLRVEMLDLGRMVDELGRRAADALRWSVQLATPLRWLHR